MDLNRELSFFRASGPLTVERLLRNPQAVFGDVVRVGGVLGLLYLGIIVVSALPLVLVTWSRQTVVDCVFLGAALFLLTLAGTLVVLALLLAVYAILWPLRKILAPLRKSRPAVVPGVGVWDREIDG
jgi:hypothetical protein